MPADSEPGGWPERGWLDEGAWARAERVPLSAGRARTAGVAAGRTRRRRWLNLAAVAVVAVTAGTGVTLAIRDALAGPAPVTIAQDSQGTGAAGAGLGPGFAPGAGSGTAVSMLLAGKVAAVGRTSITIAAPGHPVTAVVTTATFFAGAARSLSAVRVGDRVAAQLTETGGATSVIILQDPAS
jgi:hypothetical protein